MIEHPEPRTSYDFMHAEATKQGFSVGLKVGGRVKRDLTDGAPLAQLVSGFVGKLGDGDSQELDPDVFFDCVAHPRKLTTLSLKKDDRVLDVSVDDDLEEASREALRWLRTVTA